MEVAERICFLSKIRQPTADFTKFLRDSAPLIALFLADTSSFTGLAGFPKFQIYHM